MKLTRIKFRNMTPLHLGLGRDTYDVSASVLQSDAISAALASIRAMQGKGDSTYDFLNSFALSSAFPYDGTEYFLPRMKGHLAIKVNGQEEKEYRKKLKKLAYISTPVWKRLTEGKTETVEPQQLHGFFLLSSPIDSYKPPMTHVVTERVSVSRSGETDAVPFMFDWTFFKNNIDATKESGLYCLLEANEAVTQEVVKLFEELGEAGIGSDKSVGGGKFNISYDCIDLPEISSNRQILLSTYIPTEEELSKLDLSSSNYQIILRGGFMAGSTNEQFRHLRKKTVYMFDTGSVLTCNDTLKGCITDVTPKWNSSEMHKVLRSGKPLTIHIL